MKKILLGLTLIASITATATATATTAAASDYSEDFSEVSIDEIYNRGYMLEATINVNEGIVVGEGVSDIPVSEAGKPCLLYLKRETTEDSILKYSRKITFNSSTFKRGVQFNRKSSVTFSLEAQDKTINRLDYDVLIKRHSNYSDDPVTLGQILDHSSNFTLANLQARCSELDFTVVKRSNLQEL